MPAVRVLIVDDDESIREMLDAALKYEDDVAVVGVAPDGEAALALARTHAPDVVVLDHSMPGMGGLDIVTRLTSMGVSSVIMYTGHLTPTEQAQASQLGATVLTKGPDTDPLVEAILRSRRQ